MIAAVKGADKFERYLNVISLDMHTSRKPSYKRRVVNDILIFCLHTAIPPHAKKHASAPSNRSSAHGIPAGICGAGDVS